VAAPAPPQDWLPLPRRPDPVGAQREPGLAWPLSLPVLRCS